MKQDGNIVKVVTATYSQNIEVKMKLLQKYFPFSCDDIIITSCKNIIKGDYLIDDAPHDLIGGEYKGLLINMPHNQDFSDKDFGIVRANDLMEAYEIITNA